MNKITGFDGTETIEGFCERPEKYKHLFNIINASKPCIPKGAGLSYCLASAGNAATSIDMTKFNRILAFDEVNGVIKIESGIAMGNFIRFIVGKGWYFSAVPGYPSITVGGCVAFNVHGKSQSNTGNFGDQIIELTLFHPAYGEMKCSKIQHQDIFDLTIGGFGLTGVILDVTLSLSRLQGNAVSRKKIMCSSIAESVDLMISLKNDYENVYSWNNLNLKGQKFGKGIIYLEKPETSEEKPFDDYNYKRLHPASRGKLGMNFLHKPTAGLMCRFYNFMESSFPASSTLSIAESTFPIYGKEIYYYLFGKQGFREYQLIVPFASAESFFTNLKSVLKKSGIPVTLGSLKLFRGKGRYLNFSQDGVCLAIDVPATNLSGRFFSDLDDLVIRHSGIANLSKDSRLKAKSAKKMYDQYSDFKTEILKFDPEMHFNSELRQRMEV